MLEAIEKLLALQDRDQRLRTLRLELQSIPTEIASKQKLVQDAANRLDAARSRSKAIEVEKKALDVEIERQRAEITLIEQQEAALQIEIEELDVVFVAAVLAA